MSRERPADPAAGAIDDAVRADVLDVLDATGEWELTAARWTAVRRLAAALGAALRAGDAAAVRLAVRELELVAPSRAIGLGEEPTGPAPEPVREEIAEIVHTLDGAPDDGR